MLFCAAKRSGEFPPDIPAGLRARVLRLGGFTRPFSGFLFPPAGSRLFVITGKAATSRSRSSQILRGWWFVQRKDFTGVLIAAGRARKHHQQRAGVQYPTRILIVVPRPLPAGAPLLTCSFGGKYSSNPQRFFLDFTYQMFKKAWFTTTPR